MAVLEYDAIVDVNRQGNYLTVQAADDALDGGAYMAYVKAGTYAGFTISTPNVVIFCEPNTVFTSAITLSGAGVCLILSAGCDVQGLLTLSGVGNSVICENGVDLDGVACTAASCYVTGGGWDTLSDGAAAVDGIQVTATDCIVEDIACQTTAGGGNSLDGVSVEATATRTVLVAVKVVDSDDVGISINSSTDTLVEGCLVLGADADGLVANAARARILSTGLFALGTDGLNIQGSGDDSVVVGNIVDDTIVLDAGGDNSVVVGNRVDTTLTDSSTGSTVAQNDTTAF